ncbi:MerR family transcriptional regulator [Vagococcus intermedius]|uniref:MerR family transcriptional regulator n=1 Tax=Vagococcus intermedius TaxID=2991418 RepID=A0AAF0CW47_9ENTE|nr:MerR family transcriptional regulator [Vagococcus intermedius]WEG73932.1 MerR family transcriptional regulator [Vagococcus intermedius]WEG76013.1 MerR family transcriptional regulator [Vagococcus intermedius]
MSEKELRKSMSVFPIGTVIKLTDLSARQIRYYEAQKLVTPKRTDGNQRTYSLNDVDRLLEVKDWLKAGYDMAGIRSIYQEKSATTTIQWEEHRLTDNDVRRLFYDDILSESRLGATTPFKRS